MNSQIIARLRWYFDRTTPKPSWFYRTDGWVKDPEEIIRAIRQDDVIGLVKGGPDEK